MLFLVMCLDSKTVALPLTSRQLHALTGHAEPDLRILIHELASRAIVMRTEGREGRRMQPRLSLCHPAAPTLEATNPQALVYCL